VKQIVFTDGFETFDCKYKTGEALIDEAIQDFKIKNFDEISLIREPKSLFVNIIVTFNEGNGQNE
jgi:hypothetical protein